MQSWKSLEVEIRAHPDGAGAEVGVILVGSVVFHVTDTDPDAAFEAELLGQEIFRTEDAREVQHILMHAASSTRELLGHIRHPGFEKGGEIIVLEKLPQPPGNGEKLRVDVPGASLYAEPGGYG